VLQLVLVRHGQTEWSRDKRHTGRTDIPLTPDGVREAKRVQAELEGRDFARVLSSPLSRALETARLASLGDRVETRDELLEWDYGEYEGVTTAQIHEKHPDWVLWRDGCPGGEGPDDVGARADRLLAELASTDGDAAVFGHGHMLRVLTARWVELGPAEGAPNYVLRRFRMEKGGGMPLHTNEVEHEQYVLRGRATVRIGDDVHQVGPDDALYIPAGTPHSYDVIEGPFEFICVVPNLPDEIKLENC
jgi:probable phosphoglycerate mutase